MGCKYHVNETDIGSEEETCPQQEKRIESKIVEKTGL